MMHLPAMVDMARTPEEKKEETKPLPDVAQVPDYPWGLRICLTERELEKLGLEAECEVGDILHLNAFAKVTSVSISDSDSGKTCRIELVLTHIAAEDEDEEAEEAPRPRLGAAALRKLYAE